MTLAADPGPLARDILRQPAVLRALALRGDAVAAAGRAVLQPGSGAMCSSAAAATVCSRQLQRRAGPARCPPLPDGHRPVTPPRLLVVGYLSIDTVVTPDARWNDFPEGAALYAALGARRAGAHVTLAAAVGDNFPLHWLRDLAELGVDTSQVERRPGRTRRALLVYELSGRRSSLHHRDAVWHERTTALLPPLSRAWPGHGHAFDAVVAGPVPLALLARVLRIAPCPVVADTSEAFAGAEPEAILALLPSLHAFAPSMAETRLLRPGLTDDDAAWALAALGPRVLQKRGSDGALAVADGIVTPLSAPAAQVIDPTGAGDATAGALAALLAAGQTFLPAASLALQVGPPPCLPRGQRGLASGPILPSGVVHDASRRRRCQSALWHAACAAGLLPLGSAWHGADAVGAVGLRQDHACARDCRICRTGIRPNPRRGAGHHDPATEASPRRPRVPELRAIPAPDGRRQRRLRLAHPPHSLGRSSAPCSGGAGVGGARHPRRPLPRATVGRAAAACRGRAGAGVGAVRAAVGDIYERPHNDYVATFIGQANLLAVQVVAGRVDGVHVSRPDCPACLVVRPENLRLEQGDGAGWPGTIVFSTALGASVEYEVHPSGVLTGMAPLLPVLPRRTGEPVLQAGTAVRAVLADPAAAVLLPRSDVARP